MNGPVQNTDKEIWRETPGDFYSPSIHVTKENMLRVSCGGISRLFGVSEFELLAGLFDPTPIDEEFAASVRSNSVDIAPHGIIKNGVWRVHVWSRYNGDTTTCMSVETRGQVRMLLAAAGVK